MKTKQKRRRGDRYDARRVRGMYDYNALFPYLMRKRNESIVFFSTDIDAEPVLSYIEERKKQGETVTFFQTLLLALALVLRERPSLNRYISGRRIYQREEIQIGFVAKREMTDEGSEANLLLKVKPDDDPLESVKRVLSDIKETKEGAETEDDKLIALFMHLPRGLLRFALRIIECFDFYFDTPKFLRGTDPLRCSAFVANLGSVGIDAPYHHLYEWGNCSIFVAIGMIRPKPCIGDDGNLCVKRMVEIKVSMDERIADGFYCARSLDIFKDHIKHPEQMFAAGKGE